MADVFISVGSNLNDRHGNIRWALDIMTSFFRLDDISSLYETEPWGWKHQGWFINAVITGGFREDPLELLKLLKDVESRMGRTVGIQNAPRPIDLDIIVFEKLIVSTNELTIPHPRVTERKFVLLPLKDVLPDFIHPESGKHIDQLIRECPDQSMIYRIGHLWRKDDGGVPDESRPC